VNPDADGRGVNAAEGTDVRGPGAGDLEDGLRREPRSLVSLTLIGLLALLAIAGFTSLGVWQIERRSWKLDLIKRTDARVHEASVAAPGPADWPSINSKDDEYRRVRVTGQFLDDRETLVTAVTVAGAGYWVLTPLKTDAGFIVLINRGFVPPDRKETDRHESPAMDSTATVTGLLRMTEPKGAFLRANDVSADKWFSRDVDAIAIKRGLDNYAPYFIDADATPNPGGYPIGGLTVIDFPNNHLVYALTWFALALMAIAAAVRLVIEELHLRQTQSLLHVER
jgi:surfeit locus 1 family protein